MTAPDASPPPEDGRARLYLAAICAAGVALRLATSALWPNIAHPDETFQYLEPAYRVLTGHGLVPWEYAVGARSWMLPGLLVPPLKVGMLLSGDPGVRLWCVTLFMSLLSVVGTVSAYGLGRRAGDVRHGLLAALLAACWCELVYLSPHPLADTIAALPLIAALATIETIARPARPRVFAAGLLFGLTLVARVQLGPTIAAILVLVCAKAPRARLLPLASGVCTALALFALVDWLTWGAPFQSLLVYVKVNGGGIADLFGTEPPGFYVAFEMRRIWLLATPLVVGSAAVGARRLPLTAFAVLAVVATFSLVGHKEPRFIYPALPLLFVLCAVGSVDLGDAVAARLPFGRRRRNGRVLAAASLVWIATSLAVATDAGMQRLWHRDGMVLAALRGVDADPSVCGVAIDPANLWSETGAVRLRDGVALYDGEQGRPTGAFNVLLITSDNAATPRPHDRRGSFHRSACFGTLPWICVFKRPGTCNPASGAPLVAEPGADLDAVLRRLGIPRR